MYLCWIAGLAEARLAYVGLFVTHAYMPEVSKSSMDAGCRWNFIKVDGFIEHGREQRLIKEITGKENVSENI